jgi:hypothetical protein
MKILATLYVVLLALIVKDSISDIRRNDISVLDFLFPAIFILLGTIVVYTALRS